ncbi:mitochondrial ribonuclease P catalytic subunit-like [Babylonia areolata]|uniref:mitochondrial ribonuclease P catalytic subunit-like n=1 Tax=Babylonia areolata TaxID=304850 RepID=UPI003FD42F29
MLVTQNEECKVSVTAKSFKNSQNVECKGSVPTCDPFRSEKEKWICKWTSVNTVRGDCHQCKHRLDRIELSSSEFETLQREFLERALVKSNVYLQSNPQEVELFRDFVMEHAPFDVVLDALNIACKGQGRQSVRKSKQLRDIVHYFARERHMKVLVIGRAHMKKWPAADMAYISRHAKAFFTENISSDDPFCLYATLFSGQDCLFVSGDFMRDHKYNLGPAFKETFERWQKSRQIVNFTSSYPAGISVTMPSQFDCGPVKDEKGWHIPYNNGTVNFRSETQPVLCLRYKGERKTASKHSKKKHLSA